MVVFKGNSLNLLIDGLNHKLKYNDIISDDEFSSFIAKYPFIKNLCEIVADETIKKPKKRNANKD